MKYDITEKLKFEENPIITIKNVNAEIIAGAMNVIQAIALMDSLEDDITNMIKAYELLFSEADRKKIDKLNLNVDDFAEFLRASVSMASGNNPEDETEGNE